VDLVLPTLSFQVPIELSATEDGDGRDRYADEHLRKTLRIFVCSLLWLDFAGAALAQRPNKPIATSLAGGTIRLIALTAIPQSTGPHHITGGWETSLSHF